MHDIELNSPPDVVFSSDVSGSWGNLVSTVIQFRQFTSSAHCLGCGQVLAVKVCTSVLRQHSSCSALASKYPTIMQILQCSYYSLALFNVHLQAEHVLGVHNAVALSVFRQLLPTANHIETPLPPALINRLSPDRGC